MAFGSYDWQDVRRGVRDPSLLGRALKRRLSAAAIRIDDLRYELAMPAGYDLAEEEWDVLVLLDGCRYDVFSQSSRLEGALEPRVSPASESWEFLRSNFQGRTFHDTVYVTANPHWYKLDDGTFHHVVDLLSEAWDPELGTVRPESVVEHALGAHDRFPRKRLIVHFMQPHFPFIGDRGRRLEHKGISRDVDGDDGHEAFNVWTAVELGELPLEAVADAYEENLEVALPHVERLLEELPGRKVVTADHGNLLGERLSPIPVRGYGHPRGLRVPELVTVPWLSVPGDPIDAVSEPPTTSERDPEVAADRLQALGYR